jgi:3'-phosphoadenosine 5'-phosphosulfate (PAPS) 3'-phosphatase
MSGYLEFGRALAIQAGQIVQSEREGQLRIQRKPDRTLVTHVDIAIQDPAVDAVVRNFPGHAVIGEERSYGPRNAKHIWRITLSTVRVSM